MPHDFPVASEADLAAQLRPHVDGLILQQRQKQALFLPHVWEQLPEPMKFIRHLKQKAGIASDEWSDDIQVQRFSTENFGKPVNEIKLI